MRFKHDTDSFPDDFFYHLQTCVIFKVLYYFSEKSKYVKKYTVVILMIRVICLWKPFFEIINYGGKSGENPRVYPFWTQKLTQNKTNMSSYHVNESKLNSVKSSHGHMKDVLSIPTKRNLIIANQSNEKSIFKRNLNYYCRFRQY